MTKLEMQNKRVIVTSGPTYEQIDPINFFSNKSSGIMGMEIALEFQRRGAEVVIITSKPSDLNISKFKEIKIRSANDMLKETLNEVKNGCDLFVSAAAVSDFVADMTEKKIKTKNKLILKMKAAPKILKQVRKIYKGKIIGFKAETGVSDKELYQIAYDKKINDKIEMIVANDVLERGMGTLDTQVLVITDKRTEKIEGLKSDVAKEIVKIYIKDVL